MKNLDRLFTLKFCLISLFFLFQGNLIAQPGNALQFTKSSSQYAVTATTNEFYSSTFTIEFWVKMPANSSWDGIIDNGLERVSGSHGWYVASGEYSTIENSFIVLGLANSGASKEIYVPIGSDNWTHVSFSFDGNTLRSYINGVFHQSIALDGGANYTPSITRPLFVGTRGLWNGSTWLPINWYANVSLDEVAYFATALSAETIAQFYRAPVTAEHPNQNVLRGYWKFDEASGTSVASNGSSGLALTLTNNPIFVTSNARIFPAGISSISPVLGTEQTTVTARTWGNINSQSFFGTVPVTSTTNLGNGVVELVVPKSAPSASLTFTGNGFSKTSNSIFRKAMPGTPSTLSTSSFSTAFSSNVGYPRKLKSGDLNLDGKPDLIYLEFADNVVVNRNTSLNGTVGFGTAQNFETGSQPSDLILADVNSDGKVDMVVSEINSFSLSVRINESMSELISFGERQTTGNGYAYYMGFLAAGDLDGDAKIDVVSLDEINRNKIGIYRNTTIGNAVSWARTDFSIGSISASDVKIADFTGDGLPEILVTSSNSNLVRMYLNNSIPGTISFSTGLVFDLTGASAPNGLAIGDLDGDGKNDVIVAQSGVSTARWYLNTSTGNVLSFSTGTTQVNGTTMSVQLEDFNGDGKLDALFFQDGVGLRVVENTSTVGAISFGTAFTFNSSPNTNVFPTIADFTDDGKPDIIASEYTDNWRWRLRANTFSFPNFAISSTTIAKGNVNLGIVRDSVLITNSGNATLTISNIVSSHSSLIPDFTSTTVPASGTKYIPFTQIYGSIGEQSNTLTLTHNGPIGTSVITVTYNGAQAVAANAGNQINLDETNDYVVKTGVIATAIDNLTIEGWFYATTISGSNRFLFYNGNTSLNGYGVYISSSGELIGILGGNALLSSGYTMPANEWVHIAFTRESGIWKLYVDGLLVTLTNNTSVPITPSGSFSIGANGFGSERFVGSVDEVRFWSTARTQTQIRQSYSSKAGNETGLVAYYRFDQSSSDIVPDFSANGNHLTAMNGPVFSSSTAYVGNPGNPSVNPYNVSFGNKIIGSVYRDSVLLSNSGSGILNYSIGSQSAPFSVSSTSVAVKPGFTKKIYYTYIPTTATTSSAGISYYNQNSIGTFPSISGTGVLTTPINAGKSLSFDGTNDFVEILDATDPTAYTIEMWVKFNSVSSAQNIITRTSAFGPNVHYTHALFLNSESKIVHYVYFDEVASNSVVGSTTIVPGKWYHIAATATNGGLMHLFINGVEEGVAATVQTLWTEGDRWNIGQIANSNMNSWFNGELDELRIWSVARTQSEIQNSYAPIAGNSTNLARIYRFDETIGITAYDGTLNTIQGTINGATRVNSSAPIAASSVTLSSFAFGNVEVGTMPQIIHYLKNPTGGVANVTLSENGTNYSVIPNSAAIPMGDSVAVTVTYSPLTIGVENATLSISGNATNSASLSGTGVVSENENDGNALVLDGSRFGTVPRMISDDFTIEFLVKTTQEAGASTGNWYSGQGIVDAEVGGLQNDFGISMGAGKILFGVGNSDVTIRSKHKLNDGLWHHVAASRNKTTGLLRLYIDGIQVDSVSAGTQALTSAQNISIGRLQTGFNSFSGTIDELRIWNSVRTTSEIRSNLYKTVQGSSSGLVAYFRFDAANGNDFQNLVDINSVLGMNSVELESTTSAPLPGGFPTLDIYSLAFSTREVGTTTPLQLTLTNNGATSLSISSVTSTNAAFVGSASVSPVLVSATSTITVDFTPNSVLTYTDTVLISHSGVGGILRIPVSGIGAKAVYSAESTKVFGDKRIGSTCLDSVNIQNNGDWDLHITNATVSGAGYSLPLTSTSIPIGDSAYFKINFSPVSVQPYPAWLIFTHNGDTSPDSIQLSGTGAQGGLSLASNSISFGTVDNGTSKSDSILVNSTGTVSVSISGINSTNARFSSTSTGEIAASESKWLKVDFSPNSLGIQNGLIVLTHDGPTSPDTIMVSGTGTYPAATTSGNSFSVASYYNTYITIPYSADINPTGNLTFEIWARPTSYSYQHQTPMTSRGSFTGYQFYLNPTNDGTPNKWTAIVGNGSAWVTVVGETAVLNSWTHLAGVVENDTLYFYINGNLAGKTFADYQPNTINPLRMSSISESVNYFFNGQLDEARVWNVAKSQSEIQNLMTHSQAGSAPGLQGYWRFDESTGYTITDYSPYGRNGSKNVYYTSESTISTTESAPLFRPYFLVGSSTIDFGRLIIGNDSTRSFSYKNIGGGTAVFSASGTTNDRFTATSVPVSAAPLELGNFEFTFAPDVIGAESGNIEINYTSNETPSQFLIPVSGVGNQIDFITQSHSMENVEGRSVQLIDFDNDGDLDVHLTGYNGGSQSISKIYPNNGAAEFGTGINVGNGYSPAFWADLDNDGDLDKVQMGAGNSITRNNGDGTFSAIYIDMFATLPNAYNLRLTDVDNDGLVDFIVEASSYPNRWLKVFKNTGNLTFTEIQTISVASDVNWEIVDWNGDGWNDILISEYNYSQITIRLLKNVQGAFESKEITNLIGERNGSLSIADVDNDDRPDVFVNGYNDWNGGYINKLFKNLNDSTAQLIMDFPVLLQQAKATFADVNSDGNLDVIYSGLATGNIPQSAIFVQQNGTWVESQFLGSQWYHYGAVGDLNADQKPDLITTGYSQYNNGTSGVTRLRLSTTSNVNSAPSAPTNLSASFDGENVIFTWDAATDAEGGPLTYTIRIGTSSGGIQIVSPHSFADGKRKIAAAGNASYRKSFILTGRNLNETFFWSVQAIDAGNLGGVFASEQTFTNSVQASITGGVEGWRFVTSSAPGTTFAELLDEIWTQGATGADATNGSPNVYAYDQPTAKWQAITDLTQTMEMGRGYTVYVYSKNELSNPSSAIWPKTLKSNRKPAISQTSLQVSFTPEVNNAGFNLVGNPFPFPIDMENSSGIERSNVNPVHYIWNAELSAYAYYIAGSQLSGNGGVSVIAPYQGFWVSANAENPEITFSKSMRYSGAASFFKQSAKDGAIKLHVSNGAQTDETSIRIAENSLGFEVFQLNPLSAQYAFVYSLSKSNKKLDLSEVKPSENYQEIPIRISATTTDSLTLKWPEFSNVPENWDVILVSKEGEIINLKQTKSWTWFNSNVQKAAIKDSTQFNLNSITSALIELEFTMYLGEGVATSIEMDHLGIPTQLELAQNYPNPFNPSTTIQFGLPKAGNVSLELYDVTGRRVVQLIRGEMMNAGWHRITFSANQLASGLYFYRIINGNSVQTKKMMFIK